LDESVIAGRTRLFVIHLCFLLSGLAALVYQSAWTRQFALVFGTSELAVATVLAAYMTGLALGARAIEQLLPRVMRPVRLYALLEVGIAVAALLVVPACLWLAEQLLIAWFGNQPAPPDSSHTSTAVFYLIAAFAALCMPTALMGATLPLLARETVQSERELGRRIGSLYAINTAGAVAGALLSAFVLLPLLGLQATIWSAAAANVLVALLAARLPPQGHMTAVSSATAATTHTVARVHFRWRLPPTPNWVLPLMLLSGAVSFFHEVLWTRMLGSVLGSSLYAFGTMLASFLAGIAIGGAVGGALARTPGGAARALAGSQLATAIAAMFAWYAIQHWLPDSTLLIGKVGFGLLVLLPMSCAIGVSYPLAVRVLAGSDVEAAPASARVYAWNTVGAIAGAIAGGFWLIPALRYEGSIYVACIASAALAVLAALLLQRQRARFVLPVAAVALATGLLFRPAIPESLLRASPLPIGGNGELLHYAVGRSATVVVMRQANQLTLRTNGLPEASMDLAGSIMALNVEAWMAPIAVLSRPQAERMLIVGLGSGRVLEAVPPSVRQIDVIELEPEVIRANRAVDRLRARQPLLDTRLTLIENDARGALALTSKRYDAILSQPSHPWTAGASHLYTREFMQRARDHLTPGGVFIQWMNAEFIDEPLLRSLLATLTAVFPELRVYRPSGTTLLFAASDAPLQPEQSLSATRAAFERAPLHYARWGLNSVEDLVACLVLETAGARALAGVTPAITDDRNRLATAGLIEFGGALSSGQLSALLAPYDPLQQPGSFLFARRSSPLAFDYIARRVVMLAGSEVEAERRIVALATALADSDYAAYLLALAAGLKRQPELKQHQLAAGLQRWPGSDLLRFAWLEPWFGALAYGKAPEDVTRVASRLRGEPAMVLATSRDAAAQRWALVAERDATLARVPTTAVWFMQATQLRVDWRARVMDPDLGARLSREVVDIVDPALQIQQNPMLHYLRAWTATGARQTQVALESAAGFVAVIDSKLQTMNDMDRAQARINLQGLDALLAQLRAAADVDDQRLAEVETAAADLGRRLATGR
jgi:spermidine synthase